MSAFDMVVVTEDDFVSMCTSDRSVVEHIVRTVKDLDVEGLCAWAAQLKRLPASSGQDNLLHAFLLTTVLDRYAQLGYELQNANER